MPVHTRAAATPSTRVRRRSRQTRRDFWIFLAFVAPNVALIVMFTYIPLVNNAYFSTLDWTLGSRTATPVGLANYVEFFTFGDAATVLSTTAIFTLVTVLAPMGLGLALAVVLNRNVPGTTFARATVFAPYVLSGVGVGLVWLYIFDPTYGLLSSVLRMWFGAPSPEWFNNPTLALVMVMIVYTWKTLGYCAIVYVAGLQSLPKDVMEAASLDGATGLTRFFHVVFPLLSPTTFFLLITSVLSSLQAFDLIRIMTPSGNGTQTLIYEAYIQAFGGYNRAGYSAMISVILFVLLLIMTAVQFRFVERKVHYS